MVACHHVGWCGVPLPWPGFCVFGHLRSDLVSVAPVRRIDWVALHLTGCCADGSLVGLAVLAGQGFLAALVFMRLVSRVWF